MRQVAEKVRMVREPKYSSGSVRSILGRRRMPAIITKAAVARQSAYRARPTVSFRRIGRFRKWEVLTPDWTGQMRMGHAANRGCNPL